MLVRTRITRLIHCTRNPLVGPGVLRRNYATIEKSSSAPSTFKVSEVDGIKIVSRDDGAPTAAISVVLRAGSRYVPYPGFSHLLEKFAWKTTHKRTAFRVTRESELLGSQLSSTLTREAIGVNAQFLRDDVPYFVEALGDIATQSKYQSNEYSDEVVRIAQLEYDALQNDPQGIASEALHSLAWRRGLGNSLFVPPSTHIPLAHIKEYGDAVYNKNNLVIVASGVDSEQIKPFVQEYWSQLPIGEKLSTEPTKYYGGQQHIEHFAHENVYALGFPGSASAPNASLEYVVLAYYLGGGSSTKWGGGHNPFFDISTSSKDQATTLFARNISYSDAGLFTVFVTGPAAGVKEAASEGLKVLKGIASGSIQVEEDGLKRAIAQAKYAAWYSNEARLSGLEAIGQAVLDTGKIPDIESIISRLETVRAGQLVKATAKLLEATPTAVAVGQTHVLPYFEEL